VHCPPFITNIFSSRQKQCFAQNKIPMPGDILPILPEGHKTHFFIEYVKKPADCEIDGSNTFR
jgi:hypothetical protein